MSAGMKHANAPTLRTWVFAGGQDRANDLCEGLKPANVKAEPASVDAIVHGPWMVDTILIDRTTLGLEETARICRKVRDNDALASTGVCVLANDHDEELLADAIISERAANGLAARLRATARRARVRDEAMTRAQTLRKSTGGGTLDVGAPQRPALFFGAPSPGFLSLTRAMRSRNRESIAAFTTSTAFDYLNSDDVSGLVIDADALGQQAEDFCSLLKRSPRLYHVPVILIGEETSWSRDRLINGDVLDRLDPLEPAASQAVRVERLLAEADMASALRDRLETQRDASITDPGTRLFTAEFLVAHLQSQLDRHAMTGRELSVVAFQMRGPEGRPSPRVFSQAAQLLRALVRAEDVPARLDWSTMLVVTPGVGAAGADIAAQRLADALDATVFDTANGDVAVGLTAYWSTAAAKPGQDAASLLREAARGVAAVQTSAA